MTYILDAHLSHTSLLYVHLDKPFFMTMFKVGVSSIILSWT